MGFSRGYGFGYNRRYWDVCLSDERRVFITFFSRESFLVFFMLGAELSSFFMDAFLRPITLIQAVSILQIREKMMEETFSLSAAVLLFIRLGGG
ncbi:hypothetical protein [Bartonella henselae]|uniref:hypothetical protein n=1 Tax=Bartonella henselae TaxID=38323 RepID=UPI00117833E9|nr:hypothetical protein [Bartonella henselae]